MARWSEALRIVVARARTEPWVLAAVALLVLVGTTIVTAGPLYVEAVAEAGLRTRIASAPVTDRGVQLTGRLAPGDVTVADGVVAGTVAEVFADQPRPGVHASLRSGGLDPPPTAGLGPSVLTVLASHDDLATHATVVDGRLPRPGRAAMEAVLPEPAARALGLAPGDVADLPVRGAGSAGARVTLVGTVRVDPTHPAWWEDPLLLQGRDDGQTFTTLGPFLVDRADLLDWADGTSGLQATWRVVPRTQDVRTRDVAALAAAAERLPDRVGAALGQEGVSARLRADGGLPALLRTATGALRGARLGILVTVLQVAVVVGWGVLLAAGLLAELRRVETALLVARGATRGDLRRVAGTEAALITLPAVAASPWLAAGTVALVSRWGPLRAAGLELAPAVTPGVVATSAAAALVFGVAVVLAGTLREDSWVAARAARGRAAASRAGVALDAVLVAALALALWQVRAGAGAGVGRDGTDPVVATAPTIALLAAGVVTVRLLPRMARAVEGVVARRGEVVAPLVAWQVARRPARTVGTTLLGVLGVAMALFAASYGLTWAKSQDEQAAFALAADLTLTAAPRADDPLDVRRVGAVVAATDGVRAVGPVLRDRVRLGGRRGRVALLGVDPAFTATDVVARPDAARDAALAALVRAEDATATRLARVPTLAAPPTALAADVEVVTLAGAPLPVRLRAVVRDGAGLVHRVPLGEWQSDSRAVGTGRVVPVAGEPALAAPVAVLGMEVTAIAPATGQLTFPPVTPSDVVPVLRVVVHGLRGTGPGGDEEVALPALTATTVAPPPGPAQSPRAAIEPMGPESVAMRLSTGSTVGSSRSLLATMHWLNDDLPPLPIVVGGALDDGALAVGDAVTVDGQRAEVVATLATFPTLPVDDEGWLVTDVAALALRTWRLGGRLTDVTAWWVATDAPEATAAALATSGIPGAATATVAGEAARRRADPVTIGLLGALVLGLTAALVVAVIGHVLTTAVTARERTVEFALLRALGLERRQLSRWLTGESAVTTGLSLVLGGLVALVLTSTVLPRAPLAPAGQVVQPPPQVVVPWSAIAWVVAAAAVLTVALPWRVGAIAAARAPGAPLREGDP